MINIFYKKYCNKLIAMLPLVNLTFLITKPIIESGISKLKQKYGWHAKIKGIHKHIKKNSSFDFYLVFGSVFSKSKKISFNHKILGTFIHFDSVFEFCF